MKKFFMALMCVAAIVLTGCKKDVMSVDPASCDNTVEKCWEMTVTGRVLGISSTVTSYVWATERVVVTVCQEAVKTYKATGMTSLKVTYKAAPYKTEEACDEADMKELKD